MPSSSHLRRNLPVWSFGIALAVLIGGALIGYLNAQRLIANERLTAHSDDAIVNLTRLLSTLRDAEQSQRSYLLTGDESYPPAFHADTARIQGEFAKLTFELSASAGQRARVATLQREIGPKLAEVGRTIALEEAGDRPAALAMVGSSASRALMNQIRAQVAAIQNTEYAILERRAAESERNSRTTIAAMVAPTLIAAALLALLFYLGSRNLRGQRRAAAEIATERERLRVTLGSIGDAVLTTDRDGCINFVNPPAEALTGWSSRQMLGKPLAEVLQIVNEQTRARVESPAARTVRDGTLVGSADNTLLIRKDGSERPIDERAAPILDAEGVAIGCVLVFRDVTDRRRIEQQTYEMMMELRAADRHKDEFLALLAHELRGPLAPLRNGLEVIKRSQGGEELLRRTCISMERQVEQLIRLINDLLDASRIARGKIELRRAATELGALIREVLEGKRPQAEAAGLTLDAALPAEPLFVDGDPVRLTQVFRNLLENARKYTDPGGHIEISLAHESGQAVVRVKDTGVGIPPNKLDAIFEMFVQISRNMSRSQGGLGIGLALAKRLLLLHGGTIEAFSEGPGRGSEFVVRLPLAAEAHERESPDPFAEAVTAPRRILIVDDNPDAASSLAMLLRLAHHETYTAHDGLEALSAAERLKPDVVLLDVQLPELDGYEVCRRIRQRPWARNVTLVAVTGLGQERDQQRSKEAGFDALLIKPPDYAEITRLLMSRPALRERGEQPMTSAGGAGAASI
ncbi:MAG: ATP-binding protein [Steroidobacteraceae bacterium]